MSTLDEFKQKKREFKEKITEVNDRFDSFDDARDVGKSIKIKNTISKQAKADF